MVNITLTFGCQRGVNKATRLIPFDEMIEKFKT